MTERRIRLQDPLIQDQELGAELDNLFEWTRRVTDLGNSLPSFSIFSTVDGPEDSGETAERGTLGVDLGSSETILWIKKSSGTTGWEGIK